MSYFFCDNCSGRRYEVVHANPITGQQEATVRCDCTVIKEETGNPTESLYWARVRWENAHTKKKPPPEEDGPDPDQVWASVLTALSVAYMEGQKDGYCDIEQLLKKHLDKVKDTPD